MGIDDFGKKRCYAFAKFPMKMTLLYKKRRLYSIVSIERRFPSPPFTPPLSTYGLEGILATIVPYS